MRTVIRKSSFQENKLYVTLLLLGLLS